MLIKLPVEVAPWIFCRVDCKKLCKVGVVDWLLVDPCPPIKLSKLCCSEESGDVLDAPGALELLDPPKIDESDPPLDPDEENKDPRVAESAELI